MGLGSLHLAIDRGHGGFVLAAQFWRRRHETMAKRALEDGLDGFGKPPACHAFERDEIRLEVQLALVSVRCPTRQ